MLSLKEKLEKKMKAVLGASYSHDLLELMFTQPYLKIEILQKRQIAHRQTASLWLNKLVAENILLPHKMGRTTYFINHELMDILAN